MIFLPLFHVFPLELRKGEMELGPKHWRLKIYDWVGISGDFVLEVRRKDVELSTILRC